VGEDSKVPNVGGIRKALVDELRKAKPAVIRWPGRLLRRQLRLARRDRRARHTSAPYRFLGRHAASQNRAVTSGAQRFDSNRFGTNEFHSGSAA